MYQNSKKISQSNKVSLNNNYLIYLLQVKAQVKIKHRSTINYLSQTILIQVEFHYYKNIYMYDNRKDSCYSVICRINTYFLKILLNSVIWKPP